MTTHRFGLVDEHRRTDIARAWRVLRRFGVSSGRAAAIILADQFFYS